MKNFYGVDMQGPGATPHLGGAWSERVRQVAADYAAELGGGELGAAKRALVRQAAVLSVELEKLEWALSETQGTDLTGVEKYARAAGGLRRLLSTLGIGSSRRKAAA